MGNTEACRSRFIHLSDECFLFFNARLPHQRDHSPEPAPSASLPGQGDHETEAEDDGPAHATQPSRPRSLSPSAASQDSQPTPRSHLVPETAASSPSPPSASLQPLGTDTHQHTAASAPVGPAPPGFPPLSLAPGPDARGGAGQDGEDRETPGPGGARTPPPQLGDKAAGVFVQDGSALR